MFWHFLGKRHFLSKTPFKKRSVFYIIFGPNPRGTKATPPLVLLVKLNAVKKRNSDVEIQFSWIPPYKTSFSWKTILWCFWKFEVMSWRVKGKEPKFHAKPPYFLDILFTLNFKWFGKCVVFLQVILLVTLDNRS